MEKTYRTYELIDFPMRCDTERIEYSVIVGSFVELRSAMAGRLYKLHAKHTSNSGFDQTFMPCTGFFYAAEEQVGYQISWVDLQREEICP